MIATATTTTTTTAKTITTLSSSSSRTGLVDGYNCNKAGHNIDSTPPAGSQTEPATTNEHSLPFLEHCITRACWSLIASILACPV